MTFEELYNQFVSWLTNLYGHDNFNVYFTDGQFHAEAVSVPEPSTLIMTGLGVALALIINRIKRG